MQALPSLRLLDRPRTKRTLPSWWPALLVYGLVLLGLSVSFVRRKQSEWDTVFVPTAAHLLAGEDLYHQPHGFTYPPFQALFALPVVDAPLWLSRMYWFTINAICLTWMLYSTWQLAEMKHLLLNEGSDEAARRSQRRRLKLVITFGLLVALPFCLNALSHQQTDLVLFAFLMAGCARLANQQFVRGAIGLGLAAAMKCTPLLFAPYLLIRGRWIAACVVVAVALGANLLPDLIHRPNSQNATWLTQWYEMFFAPMTRSDYTPGVWASEVIYNQSFIGATNRWTHTRWEVDGKKVRIEAMPPSHSPTELKKILLALMLVAGLIGLVAVWYPGAGREAPTRSAWECSIVFAGMLLFSPMSSPSHFGILILPAFLLGKAIISEKRYSLMPFAFVMMIGSLAINKDLVGGVLHTLGLWYGVAMWSAVAALFGAGLGRISASTTISGSTPAMLERSLQKAA